MLAIQNKPKTQLPDEVTISRGNLERTHSSDLLFLSSPPVQTEFRVIAVVALGLVLIELMFSTFENRLSKDVQHLQSFDDVATNLAQNVKQGRTVLFLGNSMTRYGVVEKLFNQELHNQFDGEFCTAKLNPDNTALADWYYLFESVFVDEHKNPDLVVIGFGDGHLSDHPSRHPNRLARYYHIKNHWDELTHDDLNTFETQCDYLLAKYSTAYADRDRIQRKIFDSFIPEYQAGMQELNHRMGQGLTKNQPQPSYHRLQKLLLLAQQCQTRIVFVAMPMAKAYEISDELQTVLKRDSFGFIDCRVVPGISASMIPDGVHMNANAAEIYTTELAHQLGALGFFGKPIRQTHETQAVVPAGSSHSQNRILTKATSPGGKLPQMH